MTAFSRRGSPRARTLLSRAPPRVDDPRPGHFPHQRRRPHSVGSGFGNGGNNDTIVGNFLGTDPRP